MFSMSPDSCIFPYTRKKSLFLVKEVMSVSCVQLFETPWTVAYQPPLSMGFFRQEYWSGLPFPSPGYLPNPGIEPESPALQAYSEPPGKPLKLKWSLKKFKKNQATIHIVKAQIIFLSKLLSYQKVRSDFSVTMYRKTWSTFLTNPISTLRHIFCQSFFYACLLISFN